MRLPTGVIETRNGDRRGITLTGVDLARMRLLARWGALTTRQIASIEAGWDIETDTATLDKRAEQVRKRLRLMEQMTSWDGDVTPLVKAVTLPDGTRVWYPTTNAEQWIEGTWPLDRLPEIGRIADVIAVADVAHGLAQTVASMGARMLSGREMRTATDALGEPIRVELAPRRGYPCSLGILAGDASTGVVVEVETRERASQREYEKALTEHAQNPALTAVWVLTSTDLAQRKYRAAAATVTREHPGTRIRIAPLSRVNDFYKVEIDSPMRSDLVRLHARRTP